MDSFANFSEGFVSFVWGYGASFLGGIPLLVVFLLLAGLFFTLIYRFPQFRHFKHAIDVTAGKYDKPEDKGEISHFQALCAALSATIGLGNIAGVAVAIAAGGPGVLGRSADTDGPHHAARHWRHAACTAPPRRRTCRMEARGSVNRMRACSVGGRRSMHQPRPS